MMPTQLHPFFLLALFVGTLALVWRRGTAYRAFVGVFLGTLSLIWWGLFSWVPPAVLGVAMVFEFFAAFHFVRLVNARLRSPLYRAFLSIPVHWFAASTLLAFPFAVAAAFGFESYAFIGAFVLGGFGVFQSLTVDSEVVDLILDRQKREGLLPCPLVPPPSVENAGRSRSVDESSLLRIVQITDPHLGPFMSPEQLHAVCQRAVDAKPDLIVVTGDLLTMESHGAVDAVAHAFSPLKAFEGRVFACHGNHDHEDRRTVREGLERNGIRLLVDEWVRLETRLGPLDIVGADFHFREAGSRLRALFEGRPDEGTPRLLLLHHPGQIKYIPEGSADLTLSGHTHGGHVGLLSLGLAWTVVRGFASMPDHGLWARGRDRLYVHRGTGHYGFPIRLGVPREESVLRVRLSRMSANADGLSR
jgi:predicted MPP superfamily phosphohydrolase